MANNRVERNEFFAIRKYLIMGRTPKQAQIKYRRGETTIRRVKNAKSWPEYVRSTKARQERRKATVALNKQTDNELKRSATVLTREGQGAVAIVQQAQKQRSFVGRLLARFNSKGGDK